MSYRTQAFTFGPGNMEMLSLRIWQHRRDPEHLVARLTGQFDIYCGFGNCHWVTIREEMHGWTRGQETFDDWMREAFRGVQGAADNIASQLVEFALEGWTDPCSDVEEESL